VLVVLSVLTAGHAAAVLPYPDLPDCSQIASPFGPGLPAEVLDLVRKTKLLGSEKTATNDTVHYLYRVDYVDPESGKVVASCKEEKYVDDRQPAQPASSTAQLFPLLAGDPSQAAFGTAADLFAWADLNGDGIADLVIAAQDTGQIVVYLGNLDGTFQTAAPHAVGNTPSSIAIADLGNGAPDIVVTNQLSNNVSVLLNNGNGTFQPANNYMVGNLPNSVAIGDFTGDGKPDLAVAASDALYLMAGDGKGGFGTPASVVTPGGLSVIAANFDNKGGLDLALGQMDPTSGATALMVALSNGNGTFRIAAPSGSGPGNPDFLGFGDFNGDGNLDVAVSHGLTDSLTILLGNGDGTFREGDTYIAGGLPYDFSLLPFPGGRLGFAVADATSGALINQLYGNGNGTFQAPPYYPVPGSTPLRPLNVTSIAVADFNHDDKPDVVTSDGSVWLGQSGDQFTLGGNVGSGSFVLTGDFRGKGIEDIATSSGVALGNGNGTFQPVVPYPGGLTAGYIAAGQFDGSGHLDLAVAPSGPYDVFTSLPAGQISILLGNGDGTFKLGGTYDSGAQPYAIAIGDFNKDGNADLAVANYGAGGLMGSDPGGISIFLGDGKGNFTAGAAMQAGKYPVHLATADVNHDGNLDLVVATTKDGINGALAVLLGDGHGDFSAPAFVPTLGLPQWVSTIVACGDGIPDIVEAENNGDLGFFEGYGDGTFQNEIPMSGGASPVQIAIADLNGDGKGDLAVADFGAGDGGGGWTVLLNHVGPGQCRVGGLRRSGD
jgi:hypothetical protein